MELKRKSSKSGSTKEKPQPLPKTLTVTEQEKADLSRNVAHYIKAAMWAGRLSMKLSDMCYNSDHVIVDIEVDPVISLWNYFSIRILSKYKKQDEEKIQHHFMKLFGITDLKNCAFEPMNSIYTVCRIRLFNVDLIHFLHQVLEKESLNEPPEKEDHKLLELESEPIKKSSVNCCKFVRWMFVILILFLTFMFTLLFIAY
jgi:hypothetical protein